MNSFVSFTMTDEAKAKLTPTELEAFNNEKQYYDRINASYNDMRHQIQSDVESGNINMNIYIENMVNAMKRKTDEPLNSFSIQNNLNTLNVKLLDENNNELSTNSLKTRDEYYKSIDNSMGIIKTQNPEYYNALNTAVDTIKSTVNELSEL